MARKVLSQVICCGVFGLVCGLSSPSPALAKPQPPSLLHEIFKDFNRLEETLGGQDWKGASDKANNLKHAFLSMVPELKNNSASETVSLFVEVMGNFSQALTARDSAKSQKFFSMVQGVFLLAMGVHEYQVPPLVTGLETNVREALEKLGETSYEGVAEEMQELVVLLSQAENMLKKKGVDAQEIGNFQILLITTKLAAAVSDPVQTKDGLDAIQKQFLAFRARY